MKKDEDGRLYEIGNEEIATIPEFEAIPESLHNDLIEAYIELLAPSIIESAITINEKNPDSEVTDDEYTKWAHMLVRKANIKYAATKYAK